MDAIGQDPEGFGDKWRDLYNAENEALKAWMQANGIAEPPLKEYK